MTEFQQGMILKNICNGKHRIYIQDIPDAGYGKNCIVYCLDTDRYIVADRDIYEPVEENCPSVNVLHSKAVMAEYYEAYIEKARINAIRIAEKMVKHFKQLQGGELLLSDDTTFIVKNVHLVYGKKTADWKDCVEFNGIRRSMNGLEKLQSGTLTDLQPNSMLLDVLCKALQEYL